MEHALEPRTRTKHPQEETIDTSGRGSGLAVAGTVAMAHAMEAIKGMHGGAVTAIEDMPDVVKKAKTIAAEAATVIGPMSVTASGARAGAGREAPVLLPVEDSVIILGIVVTAGIDLSITCTTLKNTRNAPWQGAMTCKVLSRHVLLLVPSEPSKHYKEYKTTVIEPLLLLCLFRARNVCMDAWKRLPVKLSCFTQVRSIQ